MWNKLKPREKRILKLLLATVVVIFGYMFVEPILNDYRQLKTERLELQRTLDGFWDIGDSENARQKAIAQIVPTLKIPVKADQQSILFRDEITKQLQQCGLKAKSMKLRQDKTIKADGYNVWLVECQGQCGYTSITRFVNEVRNNPYYAAMEKLTLKVDSKDRNKMTFHLIVSTYAK
jgi:Tfp pilus assembly protein PilO